MENFIGFGLPQSLCDTLTKMGYVTPTPIQAQTIPLALQGKDVLGTAQTGTGKTAAFALPIIAKLIASPKGSAIVLLPTRELAVQVVDIIKKMLGNNQNIKTALLIGGDSMGKQFGQLKARPRIFVGTPGRINDHLERGSLKLDECSTVVLDETDRMLDMGFGVQLERIAKFLPKERHTLMFSATLPPNITKITEKYLKNPVRIAVGSTTSPSDNIKQDVLHTSEGEKYNSLLSELKAREGSIIVFVKTKRNAKKLCDKLNKNEHSAGTIHGDLAQRKREQAISAFRNKAYRIMVATDVAARGLDIPHIKHVINYDLPQCPEDYIHRIGRTARAGAEGSALCLVSPDDMKKWRAISRLLGGNDKTEGNGYSQRSNFDSPKASRKSFFRKRQQRSGFSSRRAA